MKNIFSLVILLVLFMSNSFSQEIPIGEEVLEAWSANDNEQEAEDEWMQELLNKVRHKINLNSVDREELKRLSMLNDLQVDNFISYRSMLGKLIDIHELQAVPDWDVSLIKKILPFVTIDEFGKPDPKKIFQRFKRGEDNLLLRVSKGGKSLLRLKHTYKNLLDAGITFENDSGEKLLDYRSFHFFVRNLGIIKRFAVGDYSVNFGQGLLLAQSFAVKKSADVLRIKKQDEIVRPYNSSGEYNFKRGAAISIGKQNWESTIFLSYRSLDANVDSATNTVTSILTSGYHRTKNELADRNQLKEFSIGGNFSLRSRIVNIGLNIVSYDFSNDLKKSDEPYNYFSFTGRRLRSASLNYEKTFRNIHAFGEMAIDDQLHVAIMQGLLVSADRNLDLAFVYRNVSPAYHSFYASSFTENSTPVNEKGVYAALSWKLKPGLRLDAYFDFFKSPFLKYHVNEPSSGNEAFLQMSFEPGQNVKCYVRTKSEFKTGTLNRQFRFQLSWTPTRSVSFQQRIESVQVDKHDNPRLSGCLAFVDCQLKPDRLPIRMRFRLTSFQTDGSDAILYSYEPGALYSSSLRAYAGNGNNLLVLFSSDLTQVLHISGPRKRSVQASFSVAQTAYNQERTLPLNAALNARKRENSLTCQIIATL